MTRDELIWIIFNDTSRYSCPEYSCNMPEEEGNTGECCRRCAERQIAKYEEDIRVDERKRFSEWLDKRFGIIMPSPLKGDNGYRSITPNELLEQYELFKNI